VDRDLAVILVGAGEGRRMGAGAPKALLDLEGRSLLDRAASVFLAHPSVAEIAAVVPQPLLASARESLAALRSAAGLRIHAVAGGASRQESSRLGFLALDGAAPFVAVHDVARPLLTGDLIDRVLAAAREHGAAIPALPIRDALKLVERERIVRSVSRENLWGAQTPQIFARAILARAYEPGRLDSAPATQGLAVDDATLVESLGLPVAVVRGEPSNLKITDPADLVVARAFARARPGGGD
jgi:2-C-methyl-D-erythritol 4-phosphate cytidylyltransferase